MNDVLVKTFQAFVINSDAISIETYGSGHMTLECGMRFLTDYLNGDTYFRTSRANQNLDRCHTQFKLVEDMEQHLDQMKAIVEKYYMLYCH